MKDDKSAAARDDKAIFVKVRDRESVIYEGMAKSLSSQNEKGKFDILPLHANFISLLGETLIIKKEDDIEQEIPLANGVVRAVENKVEVYLGIKP
jgi:F0F1-type ATP synthase epsilon subunit